MTAIVHNQFRIDNADRLITSLDSPTYVMLGQSNVWNGTDTPVAPTDTNAQLADTWRNSFGIKRISQADARHCIQNRAWVSGTAYVQYDSSDSDLLSKAFYVVIPSTLAVYKCISNNFGIVSTVQPTGTSTSKFTTSDGYVWKYMYTIATTDAKFVNPDFVPVITDTVVKAAAVGGTIDSCVVLTGGTGYTTAPTIQIIGDGTGATATATVSNGVITKVNVVSGTGYTTARAVITGTGVQGTIRFNISSIKGHGYDAIEELGGYFVGITTQFNGTEAGTIAVNNDFRSVSIVKAPTIYGTTNAYIGAGGATSYKIYYSAASGTFTNDATVTIGSTTANVVSVGSDGSGNFITISNVIGVVPSTGTITSGVNSATISTVIPPVVSLFSGKLLYVENRSAVSRASDQIEQISIVLEY